MKTNYLQRNKSTRSNFKNAIIVIAVFILGFLIFSIFKTRVLFSLSPLWNLKQTVLNESSDLVSFFRSKNALIDENRFLKQQLLSQQSLLVSYNALNQNYTTLLKDLGQLPKEVKIAAGVITTPPQSIYDVLIIDAGKDKGVFNGSQVILPFGALIGSVTGISEKTSQITLYSSYGIKTEAILERTQTPVTLTGQGGGNYMIRVPRDIEVIKGDRILSPGLNPRILATIEDISAVSTDSFKRVQAQIPGGIYQIRFVYILK
jgi:cell shape-determining protein MreC